MYNIADLVVVGILGLFLGVFVMLIGIKLWIAMVCQPPYEEDNDWPDADWAIWSYNDES